MVKACSICTCLMLGIAVYTYKREMHHCVEYNQHQKIQGEHLDVLRVAAIMRLLHKG